MDTAELSEIIIDILKKTDSGYLLLSDLNGKFSKEQRELLKLTTKSQVKEIKEKIKPHINENNLEIQFKNSYYILLKNLNHEKLVLDYIQKNPNKSQLQVKKSLPFKNIEVIQAINKCIKDGKVFVDFNEKSNFTPRLNIVQKPSLSQKTEVTVESDDKDLIKKSYDDLIRGKRYVKICDLRRNLGWNRDRFDRLLEKLRDEATILLQPAETSTMDDQDVKDSFVDENNMLMIIVSWRK